MANRKIVFRLLLGLVCSAAILWLAVACQDRDYQCGTESTRVAMRTHEVLVKYYPQIMRLPHNPEPEPEFLRDENGELTDTWGIVILTDEKIDQYALNAEDRIPDSLEGVPVQVLTREIGEKQRAWYPGWRPDAPAHPHFYFRGDVASKNWDLLKRYPSFRGTTLFFTLLGKDSSNSDPIFGIEVTVAERVDPSTLPLEDRIPDCLDDVPVRIKVEPR